MWNFCLADIHMKYQTLFSLKKEYMYFRMLFAADMNGT